MALWFGVTFVDPDETIVSQQICGPYEDTDALEDAINEKLEDDTDFGVTVGVPIRFELVTDDVPELVEVE